MAPTSATCPRRCFLGDLYKTLGCSEEERKAFTHLRLMGTVVSIEFHPASTDAAAQRQPNAGTTAPPNPEAPVVIGLRDGTNATTGSDPVKIVATTAMATAIQCVVGMDLECIVRIEQRQNGGSSKGEDAMEEEDEKPSSSVFLIADALIVVEDHHAKELRRLELEYKRQNPDADLSLGYPCRPFQAKDLLKLIQCESRSVREAENGCTVEELSLVLDMDSKQVEAFIMKLQEEGHIYQNQHGRFVPL